MMTKFRRETSFGQEYRRKKKVRSTDRTSKPVIDAIIDHWVGCNPPPLFRNIEIETVNRCNGGCSFCPVNQKSDPRTPQRMSEAMFDSIITQLRDLDYSNTLCLYSNNEPLIDKRIYDFHDQARAALPRAKMVLFTNGTLLTVDKFRRLISNLDKLIVDNYSDDLVLHDNVREVAEYWEANKLQDKVVKFKLRRETQVLNSRGGTAPNRAIRETIQSSCLLPFVQVVVRPEGKLSLCCNDPLGQYTLGDLSKETLLEAWQGERYRQIRVKIRKGRKHIGSCAGCDTILGIDHPELSPLPGYGVLPGDRLRT